MSTQAAVENLSFDLRLVTGEFCFGFKCLLRLSVLKTLLRFRRLAPRQTLQRLSSGRPHPRGGLGQSRTPPGPPGFCEQLRGHAFPGRPVSTQTRLHRKWVSVSVVPSVAV